MTGFRSNQPQIPYRPASAAVQEWLDRTNLSQCMDHTPRSGSVPCPRRRSPRRSTLSAPEPEAWKGAALAAPCACIRGALASRPLVGRFRTVVRGIGAPVQGGRGVGFGLAGGDSLPNDRALCRTGAGPSVSDPIDSTLILGKIIGVVAIIFVTNHVTRTAPRKIYRKAPDTYQLNFYNGIVLTPMSTSSTAVNAVIRPA